MNDAFTELDQLASNLPQKINEYTFEKLIGQGVFSRVFLLSSPKYAFKFCLRNCVAGQIREENATVFDLIICRCKTRRVYR